MHKAKTCIVTCIDFRFQKSIYDFLNSGHYLGAADIISVAGSSRDFIRPTTPTDGEYLWNQLAMSVKLHAPDELIIIDHQDCGGYAKDDTIPANLQVEEDTAKHQALLTELKPLISVKYPQLKIRFAYASLEGRIIELHVS